MLPENTYIIETMKIEPAPVVERLPDYPPSDISEEGFARRFGKPYEGHAVVCELTSDIGLLHQYLLLCEDRYSALFGIGAPTELKTGDYEMLVAGAKNQTIGGCALTIKEPETGATLPMEKAGLALASVFPVLPITSVRLMEISHLVMLPDFQASGVMVSLCHEALHHAVSRNVRYVFALAPVALAKAYSKAADAFGLTCNIFTNVAVAAELPYEGEKLVLCVMDLAPVYNKKNKQKRPVSQRALVAG